MKEIELPVKSNDRLSIAEITTFEDGIILAYKDGSVTGYITFEDYDDHIWNYFNTINTAIAQATSDSLYSLINTIIEEYHITNLKLLEFYK